MKTTLHLFFIVACLGSFISINAQDYPCDALVACDQNPILAHGEPGAVWDSACVFLPHIFYENDTFYLFYSGSTEPFYGETSIGIAVSDDGEKFIKHDGPIFNPSGNGFDAHAVSSSIVTKTDTEYIMYYQGKFSNATLGPGDMIGRATSNNIYGPWERLDFPVLLPGGSGEWDDRWVMPNCVIEVDSGYLMYFQGIDFWPDGKGQIGLAFSSDGIFWEKYDDPSTSDPPYDVSDPVLKVEAGNWDDISIWGCTVIKVDDGFEMFYAAEGFEGMAIGFAQSTDAIHWIKDTTWPLFKTTDDPYALSADIPIIEYPSVLLKEDENRYYVYYDYGPPFGEIGGEIGMATTDFCVGMPLQSTSNQLGIYIFPNPCMNSVTIRYQIPDAGYQIQVTDHRSQVTNLQFLSIDGKQVYTTQTLEEEIKLDISHLPAGIYFVKVQAGEDVAVRKLVVGD